MWRAALICGTMLAVVVAGAAARGPRAGVALSPATQTVASGGTASWTVAVTNTGGAYLYAVGVQDAAVPSCGIPSSFGDTASLMPPGVTISYTCSLGGVTASLTNSAVATATMSGGAGADTIHVRDHVRDVVSCGSGKDTVYADRVDAVARDCEHVHRAGRAV